MRNLSNWFFAKYPKQQLHELNLDWIIDTVIGIDDTIENFKEWAQQTFLKPDDMSNKTFNELNTTSKSIIGAVNEVNTKSLKKDVKYIDFGGSEQYTIVEGINQVHGMATSPKMMVGNYGTTPFDVLYEAYHTNHLPTYVHKTTYEDGFTNDRYFQFYDYSAYTGLDKVMSFIEVKGISTGDTSYSLGATLVKVIKTPEGQTEYEIHDIENESSLQFFKCEYSGGYITHNNIIQNYEALVDAYNDPNKFLFVEAYGLTMIPCFFPTEDDPVLEFTSAWIENDATTISRLIINSSNQIKYEDVAVATQSNLNALGQAVINMGTALGQAVSYNIQTPTDEQVVHARVNLKQFVLTQSEYNALTTKDPNALYFIKEG